MRASMRSWETTFFHGSERSLAEETVGYVTIAQARAAYLFFTSRNFAQRFL
jgi:hypothetical protein